MLKILNFVIDEKFTDSAIEYLSTTPEDALHDFVIVSNDNVGTLKYIKYHSESITHVSPDHVISFIRENHYDAVFLHSLYSCPEEITANIPQNIKVCWFGWGYDMYSEDGTQIITMPIYKPLTKNELERCYHNKSFKVKIKSTLKKILHIPSNKEKLFTLYKKAVQRVDFFSGVLPIEYDLAKNCPYFRAKPIEYHYYGIKPLTEHTITGNNILIGNSADLRNNHLDLLGYLEKLNLNKRNVYMPLSYGGFQLYIEKVKGDYRNLLKSNYCPIETFLSPNDYFNIIDSCSIGIFYHERQQAMGNIYHMLRIGAKVFLSETSVAYNYLSNNGYHVYSVQSELNNEELNKPLTTAEKEHNRTLASPSLEYKIDLLKKLYRDIQNK